MTTVHFVTHPEVTIDPSIPVPDWSLSAIGRQRMRRALAGSWLSGVTAVFCSSERKAIEGADMLAEHLQLSAQVIPDLGENDRSATGYLPRDEFEAVADAFFRSPEASVRGWERAIDAQRRIVGAVEAAISMALGNGDIVIMSHGGVGALLLCHLKHIAIDRSEDQPDGGGYLYSFDASSRRLLLPWRPIDGLD
jgi:broad specificity phosphatase PhoE